MSELEPLEVPGGYVLSVERQQEQLRWAQENRRSNAFLQLWTSGDGRKVVTVVDLYDERWPTLSVTNDAENVVRQCFATYGDHPVVYRDTEGNWDELQHREGHFACYRSLNTRDPEQAIDTVLALHDRDAEEHDAN